MSKQAQAKEKQGFRKDSPKCGNCRYFSCIEDCVTSQFGSYITETNLRCDLGNFKVGKSNWCNNHEFETI